VEEEEEGEEGEEEEEKEEEDFILNKRFKKGVDGDALNALYGVRSHFFKC
jgi:hypothetical protein